LLRCHADRSATAGGLFLAGPPPAAGLPIPRRQARPIVLSSTGAIGPILALKLVSRRPRGGAHARTTSLTTATLTKEYTMAMETLANAFYEELRDVLSAERQLTKALPKMAKNASSPELKKAFEDHLKETEKQVQRVEQAFEDTGKAARAKTCEAMKGLIEEGEEVLEQDGEPAVKDALMIAAAQKVEHYEIATYGTLCTWAKALGYDNALKLLKQNIDEEEQADSKLSKIAQSINAEALAPA
jgi:ferritin-like metal-binding protein YciE